MPIAAAYRRAALMRATGSSPTAAKCADAAELKRALMSAHGTSRHFAAPQQFGRFQTEADISWVYENTAQNLQSWRAPTV